MKTNYKTLGFIIIVCGCHCMLKAQTLSAEKLAPTIGKNFTVKRQPRIPVNNVKELATLPLSKQNPEIIYYDGLGRVSQVVNPSFVYTGTSSYDLIYFNLYDKFGRQEKNFLKFPLVSSSGIYVEDPIVKQKDYYKDEIPFGEVRFDNSPLNRVLEVSEAGKGWEFGSGNTTSHSIEECESNIVEWGINAQGKVVKNGFYSLGDLEKRVSIGVNSKKTVEYVNVDGNIVRRVDDYGLDENCKNVTTDYVFDEFGLLRCVLPPLISKNVDIIPDLDLNKLGYYYVYDGYGRLVEKTLPGFLKSYYVYDEGDRICMSQNAKEREKNRWRLFKYDYLGRLIQEATYSDLQNTSQPAMQIYFNLNQTSIYSGVSEDRIQRELYYDNYESWCPASLVLHEEQEMLESVQISVSQAGMLTGERNRVLNPQKGMPQLLKKAYYYDNRGRMVQVVEDNHLKGISVTTTKFAWCGDIMAKRERHSYAGGTTNQYATTRYDYYDSGQLRTITASLNGAPYVEIARYTYDELGRKKETALVGSAGANGALQKLRNEYNIKGWLTKINDPQNESISNNFALRLSYDKPIYQGSKAFFDGNIGEIEWLVPYTHEDSRCYQLFYDRLNRLENSKLLHNQGSDGIGYMNHYSEQNIQYDISGNILSLDRTGGFGQLVDQLRYSYNGNQLVSLKELTLDSTPDNIFTRGANELGTYEYDANGNMKMDTRKGITLTYNYLDLPHNVSGTNISINYVYDATGRKLEANLRSGAEVYDYLGSFILKGANVTATSGRTPESWLHEEGRAVFASNTWSWEYHLKDHLGNTRVVLGDNGNGTSRVEQVTDYYPFGASFRGTSNLVGTNRWKYNGKESQEFANLGLLDYGARFYDPELGRWHSVDPKAEKIPITSPYAYCFNNPIRLVDPDGKEPTPAEAARMAAHVYGDKKDNILTGGWQVSNRDFGIQLQDATGLKSQVYERVVNGKVTEYTYATAGTEANWKDVGANVKQTVGLSDQYHSAAENAKTLSKTLGSTELTYTGHSKGGAEAALNSLLTDRKAITFNAAGVSDLTKAIEGNWKTLLKPESKIDAYIMLTDPLNALQNSSLLMPDVNGNRLYLRPTDGSSIYNGHSIDNVLKNYGVKKPEEYNKK